MENKFRCSSNSRCVVFRMASDLDISQNICPIELRLSPVWASRTDDIAILKIEVINRSKATVKKRHILLQILEFDAPESGELSEFIPFTEKARQLTRIFHESC